MILFFQHETSVWKEVVMPLLTAVITLAAGWIGAVYGVKQVRVRARLDFVERQLREFYAPLLGIKERLTAKHGIRLKINQTGDQIWEQAPEHVRLNKIKDGVVEREIEYNNRQVTEELMPLYRQMADVFTSNMGLAEPETTAFYRNLIEYIELRDRYLNKSIDPQIVKLLDHGEEMLKPLYQELEIRTRSLQKRLKK